MSNIPAEFRAMLGLDKPERDRLAPVHLLRPVEADSDSAARYGSAALTGECDRVAAAPDGTRNDTLNRAAFNLAQLVDQHILDRGTVVDNLRSAALMAGLPEREVDLTLASAFKGAGDKPRHPVQLIEHDHTVHVLQEDPCAATAEAPGTRSTQTRTSTSSSAPVAEQSASSSPTDEAAEDHIDTVKRLFPVINWHELWADDSEEEWILEPIIPARRLVALYSPPKVGKSLLMLEIAVAVAQGADALGTTSAKRKVLYVDFENDPRGDVRERLQAMGAKPDDLTDLCYLSYPTLAKLDSERGGIELVTIAKAYDCELIVIDTISRAVAGEENENDTWLNFYRHTGLLLKQAGIACVRLDHSGKDLEKGMRGGSAKYGDVDAVWKLSGVTEDTYRLDCTDHRLPIAEKTIVFRRQSVPRLLSVVQAEGRMAAWRAQDDAAVALLDSLRLPNDIGREKARQAIKEAGQKVSNRALQEALRLRKLRPWVMEEGSK